MDMPGEERRLKKGYGKDSTIESDIKECGNEAGKKEEA